MEEILLKFLPGIIAAIIASYLAARWSLRKIYSEKWWERKERAYSEIIASLCDILQFYEFKKDHYGWGRRLSEDKENEIEEKYREAYWNLKKVTDIGGFVISNEAAKVLEDLRNMPTLNWDENPPNDVYEQDYLNHKQTSLFQN
jgi:hypothetical protein